MHVVSILQLRQPPSWSALAAAGEGSRERGRSGGSGCTVIVVSFGGSIFCASFSHGPPCALVCLIFLVAVRLLGTNAALEFASLVPASEAVFTERRFGARVRSLCVLCYLRAISVYSISFSLIFRAGHDFTLCSLSVLVHAVTPTWLRGPFRWEE